jgi:hypothetical protein
VTRQPEAWTLALPWREPPLHLNQRLAWQVERPIVATVRDTTRLLVKRARIPRLIHAEVRLVWTVPDRRVRDVENPVPTLKACCDGMTDTSHGGIRLLGIVPDDSPEWMTKHMPEISYRRGCKGLALVITGRIDERRGKAA